jgi:hypothetical protein
MTLQHRARAGNAALCVCVCACVSTGAQRTDSFFEMATPDEALANAGVHEATVGSSVSNGGDNRKQKQLNFALPATDTNVTLRVFVDHSVRPLT